ncbi:MAG: T9SS type A sorting domain-containing protein [Ignavibacteria bacterium]
MKKILFLVLAIAMSASIYAQTWVAQTSGVTTSLNCVSTVNANVGWVGGNGGVILLTTNGGTTWVNKANAVVGVNDVYAISAVSATTCLVSTSPAATFVFRTTDGGTTWAQVFTQVGGFIDDIRFKDATTGFMYGDPVGARWSLWKTTNAGATWDSTGLFLPQAAAEAGWNNAMFLEGNTIWFGTNNTKVYKSNNFGATGSWTSGVTTGTPNSYSVAFNGLTGLSGTTAAVKSVDGGATYSALTIPGTGTIYSFNTVINSNKFWYNRANIIYASTDNGTTFAAQFTGTAGAVYQAMHIIQDGSKQRGWSVSNTGLIAMFNQDFVPTGTWTEQTSGLATTLYSISAVSDDIAWTCGAAGKVLRTTNKGVNWTNVSGNLPAAVAMYNIYAWDANTAIVTGSGASAWIYKTVNGGVNWTTVLTTAGGFDDQLWMANSGDAYCIGDAVGGNWHLVKSNNGGDNWVAWGAPLATTNTNGTYNNAACFQGSQVWWSPVGESKIKYSGDMGTTWTDQTSPLASITAIWFEGQTYGFAGGASTSAGLLKTTNNGTTWTTVTQSFVAANSISGIVGANNSWWVSLQTTAIHTSSDNGTTWTLAYTAPAGNFYHITKSRVGSTIWGIRSTGAISRYGTPLTGVTPISTETPSDYSVSQNYPNPFNPTTKINFALPKSGLVTLKVYDITGKEVATLVNEVKNVGTYSVDFNAANLSSGMYFYKISVNGFSEVKKMSLIK